VEIRRAASLGEAIRWARWSEYMKQSQVAGDSLSPQALSLIERDRVVPRLDTLDYITERLNRPPGHFYPLYLQRAGRPRQLWEAARRLLSWDRADEASQALDKAFSLVGDDAQNEVFGLLTALRIRVTEAQHSSREAVSLALQELARFEPQKHPLLASRLNAELARQHFRLREYAEGYRRSNVALGLYALAETDDERLYRLIVHNLGWLAWRMHAPHEGLAAFQLVLDRAEPEEEPQAVGDALHGTAMCLWSIGQLDTALVKLELALHYLRRSGRQVQIASVLNNLGLILYDLGRKPESLEHFEQALTIWESMNPPHPNRYATLNEKGRLLGDLGLTREANRALEQAWHILGDVDDPEERVRNLLYRAEVALLDEDSPAAVNLLHRALRPGRPADTPLKSTLLMWPS